MHGSESRGSSFGSLLRAFRERASLTQAELGKRARLSAKAIGALERGERLIPHPSTVRALIVALELNEDDRNAFLASLGRHGARAAEADPSPITVGSVPPSTPDGDAGLIDKSQRAAAWELYVELITRIAVVELPPEHGLLRDALTSLHSLFETTRKILRHHGPALLNHHDDGELSVGTMALTILNDLVRPVLAKWHPVLLDHESARPIGVSPAEHEREWEHSAELRQTLSQLRDRLQVQARSLASAAGVRHPQ